MNQTSAPNKSLSQLARTSQAPRRCVLGLTGNPGAGKSVAAKCFEKYGAKVLNADQAGHKLLHATSPVFEQLLSVFGRDILDESGGIVRQKLGEIVFASPEKLEQLNEIVHPHIQAELYGQVELFRSSDEDGPLVIDAALIFEWGNEPRFDGVIVIAASTDRRRKRFIEARGDAGQNFDQREAAQLPQEEKIKRADVVFWNEGSVNNLDQQIRMFIQT
ncbi:MAG: dephospho-CoA kinase [Candidatus Hinthialibacter antarcticus]|nr:dephospho-CoA kinase [Candidatus Hinthialibacter antarcticus]